VLFTPQRVKELTPAIEQIINDLIDPFVRDGKVNFVEQFSSLLPATLVCDEYGFPREARDKFKHWTDAWLQMQTPNISEEEEARLIKRVLVLFEFLREHLKNAADSSAKRVIHTIATMTRKDGTPFTALEQEWMMLIVFIAGNETTVNTLTSCLYRLAINPDIQDRLRADPDKIANFVEEVLRFDPAVQVMVRKTTEEVEMQDVRIPQGADVMLCTASANRDEQFWGDNAEEFDPERPNARQHMTFGYGPHACVGMHLARRELVCAVRILLERLGNIRLADPDNPPEFAPVPYYRGMAELPLVFDVKE